MNYVYISYWLKFNITIWHVKDERFKKYRVLRNSVNDHSTEDSLQRILEDWYWFFSQAFLGKLHEKWESRSFLSKIIFYQSMWETKCHELRSMTHHQSIKKIKSHKPAGKAFCPMTLACFPLLLQQFHSPGSYATSFASCWLDLCSQICWDSPYQTSFPTNAPSKWAI